MQILDKSTQSVRSEAWPIALTPLDLVVKPLVVAQNSAISQSIRHLNVSHLSDIETHLLSLNAHDRYLRFGFCANDAHIQQYVKGLNLERDRLLGIFNTHPKCRSQIGSYMAISDTHDRLVAFAHLSLSRPEEFAPCAEFGVSVDCSLRSQGVGSRLFEYACLLARNSGIRMLFIHALSENTHMINIAKKHGATLEHQGSETECHVKLPLGDINSLWIEWSSQYWMETNENLQDQSRRFWQFLNQLQIHRQNLWVLSAKEGNAYPTQID